MIKVGDTVVCIKRGEWRGDTTGEVCDGPSYGDELIIERISHRGSFIFSKWIFRYNPVKFRKISPATFKNALTKELADDFIEQDEKVIEVEKEIVEQ